MGPAVRATFNQIRDAENHRDGQDIWLAAGGAIEVLDRSYNARRIAQAGIGLDSIPAFHTCQPFYEMGFAPPSHEEMADYSIAAFGQTRALRMTRLLRRLTGRRDSPLMGKGNPIPAVRIDGPRS